MIQLDEKKLAKLKSMDEVLDAKYGKPGTESRKEFHEKAMAWYYGDIIKDRRKQLKMTQQQLAEKIGRQQSYIARVERGESDIQISTFFLLARALGIEFIPSYR
jgi:ribosome-binding protein aMBF1 (putative translation factor)